jgi:hypothetical protein
MALRRAALAALVVVGTVAALLLPSSAPANHNGPLAGQWHLDSIAPDHTTPDSSGHGLTGTTGSNGGGLEGTDGRFADGLAFDGLSHVRVGPSSLLEPAQVSVVAWVRNDGSPGNFRTILAKGGDLNCTVSSYGLFTGGGGLQFYVSGPAGVTSDRYSSPAAPESAIWDGAWHGVAGVYDGATVRLYVDGHEVGPGTAGPASLDYTPANRDLVMGDYPETACDLGYNGRLDEVQVYDRALSATEVAALHDPGATSPPVVGPPGGGAGGSLSPLTASFSTQRSRTIRRGFRLNAFNSRTDTSLSIRKYEWDLRGDGRYEIECGGATPAVSLPILKAGNYKPNLRVTDSAGRTATVAQELSVGRNQQTRSTPGTYACEQPLGGNQADTPGCVKTFSFGIVEVNSRGAADQCFEITRRVREALFRNVANGSGDIFRPLRDFMYYHAKIKGPVALNGLPIPVPANVETEYDSGNGTISLGTRAVILPRPGGGTFKVADIPLEKKIEPKRTRDYPGGVFTLFSQKVEGDLKGWGGLKRGAGVELLLTNKASIAKVSLKLPNVFTLANRGAVEAWAAVRASNTDGFEFDGMKLGPVDAFMGPVIVSNLQFTYSRSADVWSGGADIQLLPAGVVIRASPPPPDYGFGLRGGAFDHAGGGVKFEVPPRPQLFPGIGLVEIGGAVGVNPLRFTGRLAIDAGGIVTIDGSAFMAFASPDRPYDFPEEYAPPGLEFLAGRHLDSYAFALGGTAGFTVPKLGKFDLVNSYVFYQYPGYVEFAGSAKLDPFGDRLKIEGGISGWADVEKRLFNLEGQIQACVDVDIFDACLGVGAVVSSRGIAFCTLVPLPLTPFGPTVPVPAGVGYRWGQGFPPDIMVFSCDRGPYSEAKPAASQNRTSFTVPGGLPSASVRVRGRGGPPKLVLHGPDGDAVAVPQTDPATADPDVIALSVDETDTTEVFLRNPAAGRWTVTTQDGSPGIASIRTAAGLRDPRVRARVTGSGRTRTLRYSIDRAPGQRVTFIEQGARTYSVIGTVSDRRGRLRFTPAEGRRGRRQIKAVVERNGVATKVLVVARYAAPADARPARPHRLRVRRRGGRIVVRWRRVAGVRSYAVTVRPRGAPAVMRITRRRSIRIGGIAPRARGSVVVAGLDVNNRPGRSARARIPRR